MGGVYPAAGSAPRPSSPRLPIPILYPLSPLYSHSSALICTFLHSSKTQLFSFQAIPHSASKNGPGGVPLRFFSRTKINRTRPNYSSISGTRCPLHRQPTRCVCSPRPRFVSHPHSFLLNYIDPILPRVGPAGHFPYSTQRPGS